MIILFRSCEANLSAGSIGDGTANKPRWEGKMKLEIIRKCYISLQKHITESDSIIVIDDRTTKETLKWMEDSTKASFSVFPITPLPELRLNHPYPTYHPVVVNECTELMEFLVDIAAENPDEIIYVCEDDYLHTDAAILSLKYTFNNGFTGFYVPYDYPDRYTIDSSRNADVFLGSHGHLRTVPSATLTMAALGKTWSKYKIELLRAGAFADDSWTWKAFKQEGALAPIPGHSTHLQDRCVTPYIDWMTVYNNIEV